MTWHLIRLDLARSAAHPDGSREHCYLLCIPLDNHGLIDRTAIRAEPERATVLRSSPDEPERTGRVGHTNGRWVFSYLPGDGDDEELFHLETHPLREGDFMTITDASGEARCFEVSSSRTLAAA
ncbi:hypothetical protein [Sphingomonas sp. MS122]|uniref:hypothetical protein n=1 Tax=Sphingomonas sp. MS122 TaxID=3412683 RepID=UPI003C2C4F4C